MPVFKGGSFFTLVNSKEEKMKRFWLILLSLGLVMAFSASAFAVDVKFSGSFYVAGMYLDQTNLMKNSTGMQTYASTSSPAPYNTLPGYLLNLNSPNTLNNVSTAFYYERVRIETDFIVSPGLKLVTRFDALTRIWGGQRGEGTNPGYAYMPWGGTPANIDVGSSYSIATRQENQNIAFNKVYVEYASPIGLFEVGYIEDNAWGLTFGQSAINGHTTGGIKYILPIGPLYLGGIIYKETDRSYSAVNSTQTAVDVDWDRYVVFGIFNFKGGSTGLMGTFDRQNQGKNLFIPQSGQIITGTNPVGAPNAGFLQEVYTLQPYVKAKIGPVRLEGEFVYSWGSVDDQVYHHINLQDILAYVGANVDLSMFYFGGTAAYMSGAGNSLDPTSKDVKGGYLGGGLDWNPTLIMFNNDLTYWVGPIGGYGLTANASVPGPANGVGMTNAWFFQINGGVRPIPKLDIKGSVSYAMADTTMPGQNNSYGWELDVTGTYKITNNLSYMLGVGYWWVGDYYKGGSGFYNGTGAWVPGLVSANGSTALRDEYMVINKLTLTF
jgi:hypothetical protein